MNYDALYARLETEEGKRRRRYQDTLGFWTIGEGHNIDADPHYPYTVADEPLSDDQIASLKRRDVATAVAALDEYANWWRAMEEPRQSVLADMCFQLGWAKLSAFVNTLQAMHFADYKAAAAGMRASKWYQQVPGRAEALAKIMEQGA